MTDRQSKLGFERRHPFLVAVDSDGCAFDTMELKHKECFIPNTLRFWGLEEIGPGAREAAEFVNLYSRSRGVNRFKALVRLFDLLEAWPEVADSGVGVPRAEGLRSWVARESRLGTPALQAEVERTGDPDLCVALEWTEAINRAVEERMVAVPPFPGVQETLEHMSCWADLIVCSVMPGEALSREWGRSGLAPLMRAFAGQETGSKAEILGRMASRYGSSRVLMIGDAPGDAAAAATAGVSFFPVVPGREQESWSRLGGTIADLFRRGEYTREQEATLVREFERRLPESPPWSREGRARI